MVLLATVPMAGIAATLLVGANVASQFIVSVIHTTTCHFLITL